MKLSIGIIEEALGKPTIFKNYATEDCIFGLETWAIYCGEKILNTGVLYLARYAELPESISIKKGAAMICIGLPSDIYFSSLLNLLVLDGDITTDELSNIVNSIFFKYNSLEYKLLVSVNKGRSIQYLVDLMAPFFNQNELTVCDEDFNIIGKSCKFSRLCSLSDILQPDSGMLPPEVVTFFKNDIIFSKVRNLTDPFYYDPSIFSCRCLCMNVFHGGEYTCRVVLSEDTNIFSGYEPGLLRFFTSFIQLIYDMSDNKYSFQQSDHMAVMLYNLLKGESVEVWRLESNMTQRGWNTAGPFLCACIMPSDRDFYNRTIHYYCQSFNHDFCGCCSFVYDGLIACVINLENYNSSMECFSSTYLETFRDGYFRIGYSNLFNDISELQSRYLQANIALKTGLAKYPSRWYHKFSEMVLYYIETKLTEELDTRFICAPEILALHQYDKENQGEYLNTLKVYLDNQMNAVKTAKKLYVHRATMEYRLKRIQELTNINFKNSDQILYFNLSIRLLLKLNAE